MKVSIDMAKEKKKFRLRDIAFINKVFLAVLLVLLVLVTVLTIFEKNGYVLIQGGLIDRKSVV